MDAAARGNSQSAGASWLCLGVRPHGWCCGLASKLGGLALAISPGAGMGEVPCCKLAWPPQDSAPAASTAPGTSAVSDAQPEWAAVRVTSVCCMCDIGVLF